MEMTTPAESWRPRLRRSLEFTQRHTAGGTELIVYDPRTGRYFRGGESEGALFALLDGETPLDEIAARLTSDFPALRAAAVAPFVAQLDQFGFLEGSNEMGARSRPKAGSRRCPPARGSGCAAAKSWGAWRLSSAPSGERSARRSFG